MLTPLERIKHLYAQIIRDALETENLGCTTYIFVANDTDALCALRILTVSLSDH
jgi:hypothetical protein